LLAPDGASFVTGVARPVDGGFTSGRCVGPVELMGFVEGLDPVAHSQDEFEMTASLNGAPTSPGPSRQISSSSAPSRTRCVHVNDENSRSSDVRNTQVTVQFQARLASPCTGFEAKITIPLAAGGPRNPQLNFGCSWVVTSSSCA
jgi:hypothetical protein